MAQATLSCSFAAIHLEAALGDMPLACRNRRGFSAEKRIRPPHFSSSFRIAPARKLCYNFFITTERHRGPMIEFSFLFTESVIVFGWFLFRLGAYVKNKTVSLRHELIQLLFLINLMVINRMVSHPMATENGRVLPLVLETPAIWPLRVNFLPFVYLFDYESKRDMLLNIIGNFTMFIPTGIMTPLIYKHLDSLKKTVRTGFLISLAIEIIQLPFACRASDVDDLILNTAGCLAGYGILCLVRRVKRMNAKE